MLYISLEYIVCTVDDIYLRTSALGSFVKSTRSALLYFHDVKLFVPFHSERYTIWI